MVPRLEEDWPAWGRHDDRHRQTHQTPHEGGDREHNHPNDCVRPAQRGNQSLGERVLYTTRENEQTNERTTQSLSIVLATTTIVIRANSQATRTIITEEIVQYEDCRNCRRTNRCGLERADSAHGRQ